MGRNAQEYGHRIRSYTAQRETVAALEDRLAKHEAGEVTLDDEAVSEIRRTASALRRELARRKRPRPEERERRDAEIVRRVCAGERYAKAAQHFGVSMTHVKRLMSRVRRNRALHTKASTGT